MGCGAAVQPQPSCDDGIQSQASVRTSDRNVYSSHNDDPAINLVDAEDDEIEIIYEGNRQSYGSYCTSRALETSAANAQEAPLAPEPELLDVTEAASESGTVSRLLLSKRQQEEAAKLAEQRKRFDNQRYQREVAGDGLVSLILSDPGSPQRPAGSGWPELPTPAAQRLAGVGDGTPTTAMVIGLNLTTETADEALQDCLPGGIPDDTSREMQSEYLSKKSRHLQNKQKSFDDDDEKLMKEILESVDF